MPCPHFSNDSGDCLLWQDHGEEEDCREAPVEDRVNREWCLSSQTGYRQCPVFQRFLAELFP